ncbi:type I-U CRISPR-associated RAMP protein Csb1/Cas7u [Kineosporia sp. NBRC 101731]|uniref:type I-G CRISPR-associated RAMP protein Csb1/Cas7g n=1 Tax=Kineosporia sp. NBRC 101731 TaxID=3032199 RepID=UPI0024A560C6|nr:type I-U CRISPR-associated RAMP protein Csb1/Cas7u [Kineosporia sp. NBRC 101731]GLY28097.1 hypothetical protein Kisp02_14620 [Kineosporia sp. NBRC 101731]
MSTTSTVKRHVFDVALRPVLGSTFQPTGFPDLGAATFDRPIRIGAELKTQQCLIVESVQSMANRLEGTGWDDAAQAPVELLNGLPYIEIRRAPATDESDYLTSSRTEAHRIFSAYVRDSDWDGRSGDAVLLEKIGVKAETPLDYRAVAAAVLAIDPFSLLHGVFFAGSSKGKVSRRANWPTQPRITRAIGAVIEAHDVAEVASGGRKSDLVRHSLSDETASSLGGANEGYGSIPFHRVEYTAASIVASFVVDVELLRSYGLPAEATHLLETLALWEIRTLVDGGLRLRTACDLELVDTEIRDRRDNELPSLDTLTAQLRKAIPAAAASLGDGAPIVVHWSGKK